MAEGSQDGRHDVMRERDGRRDRDGRPRGTSQKEGSWRGHPAGQDDPVTKKVSGFKMADGIEGAHTNMLFFTNDKRFDRYQQKNVGTSGNV